MHIGFDACWIERGKVDPIAAGEKRPVGIEGRHVGEERGDVGVMAA